MNETMKKKKGEQNKRKENQDSFSAFSSFEWRNHCYFQMFTISISHGILYIGVKKDILFPHPQFLLFYLRFMLRKSNVHSFISHKHIQLRYRI